MKIMLNFRRTGKRPSTVTILGEEVEVVDNDSYLGVYLRGNATLFQEGNTS